MAAWTMLTTGSTVQEFGQVLDHFEISLVEDKKRLLFAKVDRSGDGRIGYREFEDAFHLLQVSGAYALKCRYCGIPANH
jgi:hypothetical protein